MAIVEGAKPGRGAELQRAVRAGLCFEAPAREVVRAGGDENAFGNFEWDEESFAARGPVKFKAIAGLETQIDGSHKVFPRFDDAARVGVARVLIFEKFLANPFERAIF